MKRFDVTGMSCAACSARIEKAVLKLHGVESCSVNLLASSMSVEGNASEDEIIEAVVKAGYGASVHDDSELHESDGDKSKKSESHVLLFRLVSSSFFLLALMYFTMGHAMLNFPLPKFFVDVPLSVYLVQPVLAGIVLFINRKFFISGIKSAASLSPNMDTLVALGAGVSYVYSMIILVQMIFSPDELHHGNLYFEGAAMVVTLITVGKFLESISKGKTASAVKSLMKLVPDFAWTVRNGKEVKVRADELVAGDLIVVRTGNQIPADGVIVEGNCSVNESSLTGESIPVEKSEGEKVFASTLCMNGFVKFRAEKTGKDTGFAKIIHLVTEASAGKAPVQRIADKVSGVFVPVVILISILTFFIWFLLNRDLSFALNRAVSVLVISCPCALGLATPVAIMAGCGVGARNGILFKTSAALENAARIRMIAFDKTGTLTKGVPEVTDILPSSGITQTELLVLASAVESASGHPLAKAVVEKSCGLEIPPAFEFQNFTGSGVSAVIDGKKIFGGNVPFITSKCKEKIDSEKIKLLATEGKTPLVFSTPDKILGIIAVADSLKDDACVSMHKFSKIGIQTAMITGDNEMTANAIAELAGIQKVYAAAKPERKSEIVAMLKKEFGKVAMTGDGVNDAVALTSADIGIAIGAGTDVAIDSADVVLVNSRVIDAVNAIRLSRITLRIIHENLFWAFIYNILLIPLAAGAWYPLFGWSLNPMIAAACMSVSSFCVVTNALRLNLFKMKKSVSIKSEQKIYEISVQEDKRMEKTFSVEGMMCSHCEAHVKEALEKINGVEEAVADHNAAKVTVKLSDDVDDSLIKAAVEAAGYKVV